ncbi:3-keto-disaccharide hydrolase [Puia dinghuensis]|uniref:3-keto-alpha-glucoside-1,2-lyase/3-keto-2-hydroxy-glucal hydratase domain-containing protein n=1 Tax=Puia dinghuensis TaxID=1792502 RepID=A0A8J2UD73_9BACT|nr:DUF1080 domain-containing protein [Puia dinghuensis]GGB00247.1 hypothetical protein GCM10011511_24450 [Puia dinghuensis]
MMRYCLLLLLLAATSFTGRLSDPGPGDGPGNLADDDWHSLFNGRNLKGWDSYLKGIGLNTDANKVFTVVTEEGEKVIRISGEITGGLSTKKEYGDYHLQLLFKWGVLTWGTKKGRKKDSGLLYHSVGPYGADNGAWMRSQEFQVEEGNVGDYWGCAGATADIPAIKKTDSDYVYSPTGALYTFRADSHTGRHCIKAGDAEHPTGHWNSLDLYCHGDTAVQVVNGQVMMILYHCGQVDNGTIKPLTKGKIQLQSEGAEVFYKQIRIRPITQLPAEILKQ